MSKCTLHIEVDRPDRTYRGGDSITVRVRVEVDKTVTCNGLKLSLLWRTHGKGNRDQKVLDSVTPFRGEWNPGTYDYSYTFSLTSSPITYHGELVNIDWYVAASADIPWAFDPHEELDIILLPGGKFSSSDGEETSRSDLASAELDRFGRGNFSSARNSGVKVYELTSKTGLLIAAFIVGVFMLIGTVIIGVSAFNDFNIPGLLFGAAFFFICGKVAWMLSKNFFAAKKFESIEFDVDTTLLRSGEECEGTLSFIPKEDLDLESVSAKVRAKESATSGSGTNRTTYTETIYEHPIAIRHAPVARKGIEVRERIIVKIPEDAAPSFRSYNNSISWTVEAVVGIKKWPDWNKSISLEIL